MKKPDIFTNTDEIEALRARVERGELSAQDKAMIVRLLVLLVKLVRLLQEKNTKIKQLKKWLFGPGKGPGSEQSAEAGKGSESQSTSAAETDGQQPRQQAEVGAGALPRKRGPGHGRNGVEKYWGAKRVHCTDVELYLGACCPDKLCTGHLQDYYQNAFVLRLEGQPLIGATRYDQETFRCSDCQRCFSAKLPDGVPAEKYAPSADAMIVMSRYGFTIPMYRLQSMQQHFGIPLPASVQWERAEYVAQCLLLIFLHLQLIGAQGETMYHDDTSVRILRPLPPKSDDRTGLFTTGMVLEYGAWKIALYRSGRDHAGENAAELLKQRAPQLEPINKMSDASSRNNKPKVSANICYCLAHARGKFKKIEGNNTLQCRAVIDLISRVYEVEDQTREMTKEQRLRHHQQVSLPLMEALRDQMIDELDKHIVEPNSALGGAYNYVLEYFQELTAFTKIPGAPLDNNACERILRLVVLHRKNSLFYRNDHGAFVGDLLQSIITTCRLNKVDAYHYIIAIIEHARQARAHPEKWLPWNYQQQLPEPRQVPAA
jgi:transposase